MKRTMEISTQELQNLARLRCQDFYEWGKLFPSEQDNLCKYIARSLKHSHSPAKSIYTLFEISGFSTIIMFYVEWSETEEGSDFWNNVYVLSKEGTF